MVIHRSYRDDNYSHLVEKSFQKKKSMRRHFLRPTAVALWNLNFKVFFFLSFFFLAPFHVRSIDANRCFAGWVSRSDCNRLFVRWQLHLLSPLLIKELYGFLDDHSQLHVFCFKSRMIVNLCLEIDLGYDEGILVVIDHD